MVALPHMSMGIRAVIILGVEHSSACDYWKGLRCGANQERGFPVCPVCATAVAHQQFLCLNVVQRDAAAATVCTVFFFFVDLWLLSSYMIVFGRLMLEDCVEL